MRRINKFSRRVAFLMGIVLAIGSSMGQGASIQKTPDVLRFDARWWQHTNSDEQQGFIYGYMDCRQPQNAAKASIVDYQDAISEMMESQKTSNPKAVTEAIEYAWKTLKPREIDKSAEMNAGPYGFLDGEWWGGFEGPWPLYLASSDRGYLEGYLECASAFVTVQAVRRYQTAINQHYASGRESHDKIADVLQRLLHPHATPRDKECSGAPRAAIFFACRTHLQATSR